LSPTERSHEQVRAPSHLLEAQQATKVWPKQKARQVCDFILNPEHLTLQKLVKQNHGVELYRSWVNSSDFKNTQETFGTVPLQSAELAQAINDID